MATCARKSKKRIYKFMYKKPVVSCILWNLWEWVRACTRVERNWMEELPSDKIHIRMIHKFLENRKYQMNMGFPSESWQSLGCFANLVDTGTKCQIFTTPIRSCRKHARFSTLHCRSVHYMDIFLFFIFEKRNFYCLPSFHLFIYFIH